MINPRNEWNIEYLRELREKFLERYFDKLNSLFPGEVHFKWEFSREGAIFLNVELFINRETKKFETKLYVKPSNNRLFLHFCSNHPEHTFRSKVYSQALL